MNGEFTETRAAFADIDATIEVEYRGVHGPSKDQVEQDLKQDFVDDLEDDEIVRMNDALNPPEVFFRHPQVSDRGFEAERAIVRWTRTTSNREGIR